MGCGSSSVSAVSAIEIHDGAPTELPSRSAKGKNSDSDLHVEGGALFSKRAAAGDVGVSPPKAGGGAKRASEDIGLEDFDAQSDSGVESAISSHSDFSAQSSPQRVLSVADSSRSANSNSSDSFASVPLRTQPASVSVRDRSANSGRSAVSATDSGYGGDVDLSPRISRSKRAGGKGRRGQQCSEVQHDLFGDDPVEMGSRELREILAEQEHIITEETEDGAAMVDAMNRPPTPDFLIEGNGFANGLKGRGLAHSVLPNIGAKPSLADSTPTARVGKGVAFQVGDVLASVESIQLPKRLRKGKKKKKKAMTQQDLECKLLAAEARRKKGEKEKVKKITSMNRYQHALNAFQEIEQGKAGEQLNAKLEASERAMKKREEALEKKRRKREERQRLAREKRELQKQMEAENPELAEERRRAEVEAEAELRAKFGNTAIPAEA